MQNRHLLTTILLAVATTSSMPHAAFAWWCGEQRPQARIVYCEDFTNPDWESQYTVANPATHTASHYDAFAAVDLVSSINPLIDPGFARKLEWRSKGGTGPIERAFMDSNTAVPIKNVKGGGVALATRINLVIDNALDRPSSVPDGFAANMGIEWRDPTGDKLIRWEVQYVQNARPAVDPDTMTPISYPDYLYPVAVLTIGTDNGFFHSTKSLRDSFPKIQVTNSSDISSQNDRLCLEITRDPTGGSDNYFVRPWLNNTQFLWQTEGGVPVDKSISLADFPDTMQPGFVGLSGTEFGQQGVDFAHLFFGYAIAMTNAPPNASNGGQSQSICQESATSAR